MVSLKELNGGINSTPPIKKAAPWESAFAGLVCGIWCGL
jgi:hypothetical protein